MVLPCVNEDKFPDRTVAYDSLGDAILAQRDAWLIRKIWKRPFVLIDSDFDGLMSFAVLCAHARLVGAPEPIFGGYYDNDCRVILTDDAAAVWEQTGEEMRWSRFLGLDMDVSFIDCVGQHYRFTAGSEAGALNPNLLRHAWPSHANLDRLFANFTRKFPFSTAMFLHSLLIRKPTLSAGELFVLGYPDSGIQKNIGLYPANCRSWVTWLGYDDDTFERMMAFHNSGLPDDLARYFYRVFRKVQPVIQFTAPRGGRTCLDNAEAVQSAVDLMCYIADLPTFTLPESYRLMSSLTVTRISFRSCEEAKTWYTRRVDYRRRMLGDYLPILSEALVQKTQWSITSHQSYRPSEGETQIIAAPRSNPWQSRSGEYAETVADYALDRSHYDDGTLLLRDGRVRAPAYLVEVLKSGLTGLPGVVKTTRTVKIAKGQRSITAAARGRCA